MDWYWWVAIILGLGVLGYLKLLFLKKWKEKQEKKPSYKDED